MSDDDRNKTVFRPSPLRQPPGAGPGQPGARGANPPAGTPAAGGFSNTDDWGTPDAPLNNAPPAVPPLAPSQPYGGGQRDTFGSLSEDPFARADAAVRSGGPALQSDDNQFFDTIPLPPQARDDRNPLMAHAAPVLAMAAALQSGRWQVPMQEFHRRAKQAIGQFEAAIQPIYGEGVRQRAKYAVCATIDDVAQNLPGVGGGGAQWAQRNMVVTFFRENIGGDRFWDFVQEMLHDPQKNRDLIELFHACLAAGFEGRTRAQPDGFSRKQKVMASLVGALEHVRSLSQHEIVRHWQGEKAPRKPNNFWGLIGLVASIAAAICFAVFLVFTLILMFSGQDPQERVAALLPDEPVTLNRNVATLEAPPGGAEQRLRQFLADEIRQGLVVVEGNRVRTTVGTLFEPASDELVSGRRAIFEKIGRAIEKERGSVKVEGHADSDAIATIQYPDNIALSQARANTVADIFRGQISDPGRVSATGLGDTVPVASNDTAEGKAQNRRVEIVLEHSL